MGIFRGFWSALHDIDGQAAAGGLLVLGEHVLAGLAHRLNDGVEDENKLEKLSEEAITQIEEKKYDINLKSKGIENITFVGIAFYGKKLKVSYK